MFEDWRNRAREDGLKHLNEKYGEEFTYIGPGPSASVFLDSRISYYYSCPSFPGESIRLYCTLRDGNDFAFGDNYMGYYYRSQVYSALQSCVAQVYGAGKVFYNVSGYPLDDSVGPNAPFEEYASSDAAQINFTVVLSEESSSTAHKEQDIERLREKLAEQSIRCSGGVYYTKRAEYEKIDADNIKEYLIANTNGDSKWCSALGSFKIDESWEFSYANWR